MNSVAPLITIFLREYLPNQRGFSPNTGESYAYAFKIFLLFAANKLKVKP